MVKKETLKKVIKGSLFALAFGGLCTGTHVGMYEKGKYDVCSFKIKPKHSKEELEEIVKSVNTPREAFENVSENITFPLDPDESDYYPGKYCNRYYSLQESYAFKKGVCIDGAIAFAALLSDNPEYETKIVLLRREKGDGHVIGVYKKDDQWRYVSFNDWHGLENLSYFAPRKYDTIHELMYDNYNISFFEEYAILPMTPEKMKFGEGMLGDIEKIKIWFKWKKIKKNE